MNLIEHRTEDQRLKVFEVFEYRRRKGNTIKCKEVKLMNHQVRDPYAWCLAVGKPIVADGCETYLQGRGALAVKWPSAVYSISHSFYFHWVNIAKDKIAPTIFNPQCV